MLLPHQVKLIPFYKIGVDIFEFNSSNYLLVVDYFSQYIEIAKLTSYTSLQVTTHLKSIFARHGIPAIMISDNGPPFNSKHMQNFLKDWDISHHTSSPYYPRSNGLAERSIRTIKNMLKKCALDGSDPYLALLHLRNTCKGPINSPAEILMSRKLRSTIPIAETSLIPKMVDYNKLKKLLTEKTNKSQLYYNRGTKPLPKLLIGDQVLFKKCPDSNWSPGKVKEITREPRSYVITSPLGEFRRNRQHIIKYDSPPENYHKAIPISNQPETTNAQPTSQTDNKQSRYGRTIKPTRRFSFTEFEN